MAMETYFDFDAETFQITERKRFSSSSGEVSFTHGLVSPYFKSTSSEDTGFETSSDRSSQDGVLESPRSPCVKTSVNDFSCSTCPRASFDSLVSRPIQRYGSKESIKSTSSFWESNVSPETKLVLSKIRDQMRSSLEKVKKLEEEAKQIPLLQVKISILQEEKRQLVAQLENRQSLKKPPSRSSSMSRSRSSSIDDLVFGCLDRETRTIGVGEDTVHDILCKKCKEMQAKLLGNFCDVGCYPVVSRGVEEKHAREKNHVEDDDIKVFQDRCTQTRTPEHKNNAVQPSVSAKDCSIGIDSPDKPSVKDAGEKTKETSCDPLPVETRSVGVGQIRSFLKDVCVGEYKEIPTYKNNGVQNFLPTSDKSCGVQITTENIGVNVCPTVVSIGTGCNLVDNVSYSHQCNRSIGSQTQKEHVNLVSVGVGIFSIDETEDYKCSKCNTSKPLSTKVLLESNRNIYSSADESRSVGVGTTPWVDLERTILLDCQASRSIASVVVETGIDNRSVGCGDQSITDTSCQKCNSKTSRSLGVNCSPRTSEKAAGDAGAVAEICSVGVGECCLTDNYCERCFSLQTRSIGVGSGSVLDTLPVEKDATTPTPTLTDVSLLPVEKDATTPTLTDVSLLQCFTPPLTPKTKNEAYCQTTSNKTSEENFSTFARMFSDEYERVHANSIITDYCIDEKLCKDRNSARDDILFTCKLLQRHFLNNDENLDEEKLLLCIKNIEDYWFTCVTDERLNKESLANIIYVLGQHLPYLLDGIINSQDEHGNTVLHYLVTYGKFDCVSELLKTNCSNVIITNKAGYSAVMLASLKEAINPKDKVVLKQLYEKGNLNCIAQSTGQTALMLAAGTGNVDTVDLLLECGAAHTINKTDLDGSTALMCACEHGYAEVVKMLLAVDGCDASIADHDGSTCFSIAMEHNRKDIALMIYNHIQVQNSRTPKKKTIKSTLI